MSDELWRWGAVELAAAIRARTVSSREAVTSCLRRLEAVNPVINAVVDVMGDQALLAADQADQAMARGGEVGPLHGVPVTFKINVDFAGRANTNGVVAFKNRIAQVDGPPVANWRKAGAIPIGLTNVPPFSARFFTANSLHGRTLNPWNAERTPGGSSGGAAAAVAVGIGPLAHGNDRAGSVRYPAYACGVVGLRPTLGRIAAFDASAARDFSAATQLTFVQGPLARSVRDVRLGFETLAARDPRDPWWTPVPVGKAGTARPRRVAVFYGGPGDVVDPAVRGAVRQAAAALTDAGCEVEEAVPPRLEEAARLLFTLIRTEEAATTTKFIDQLGDDQLRRARASTMAYASQLDFAGYIEAFAQRASMLREWMLFFERYPLLLMPVSWELPFPVDFDQQGDAAVARMLTAHHPMLAISTLGLPGLAVPTGLSNGIPVGVQLVAGRYCEELCLSAGELIEARYPPQTPIDPRI